MRHPPGLGQAFRRGPGCRVLEPEVFQQQRGMLHEREEAVGTGCARRQRYRARCSIRPSARGSFRQDNRTFSVECGVVSILRGDRVGHQTAGVSAVSDFTAPDIGVTPLDRTPPLHPWPGTTGPEPTSRWHRLQRVGEGQVLDEVPAPQAAFRTPAQPPRRRFAPGKHPREAGRGEAGGGGGEAAEVFPKDNAPSTGHAEISRGVWFHPV